MHIYVLLDEFGQQQTSYPFVSIIDQYGGTAETMTEKISSLSKYVLFLHSDYEPCFDWDVTCTRSLHGAYQKGGHAVTLFPPVLEDSSINTVGTFPVFDRFSSTGVPIYRPKYLSQPLSTQTVWTCHGCLFAELSVIKNVRVSLPAFSRAEANLIISLNLWNYGIKTFTMDFAAFSDSYTSARYTNKKYPDPLKKNQKRAIREILNSQLQQINHLFNSWKTEAVARTVEQFWVAVGVDPENRQVTVSGRHGLYLNHTEADITEKYGSLARYIAIRDSPSPPPPESFS